MLMFILRNPRRESEVAAGQLTKMMKEFIEEVKASE